ncbi:hypothetical protein [Bradyrhizobium sp. SZCCHNS3053]|uniref:hypothetical protein n=1 Tax=Bradyrhizobium sp. SZCCHNS3053 TaxID=3057322 RepID=UPI002916709A|nr:hypothetical protein [Bradyrhizobium sp. SZCCHNS3053]
MAGIDPSMANFGIARMMLDLDSFALSLESIRTIQTEPQRGAKKVVRQNSDDLRRARELHAGFQEAIKGCVLGFTEVPSGSQHSRSALGFGMSIGILASSPIPLIEVMPAETKLASVGSQTADKPEIIAWAAALYPEAPWLRYQKDSVRGKKRRRAGDLHDDNEHVADACAVAHAGIGTSQFKQMLALLRATNQNLG